MIYYPRTCEHEVPMTPTERTRVTRVELYGRETLPRPAQSRRSAVVDRLEALSAAGHIAAFDVSSWPKRVPCSGPHCEARDRYRAFSAWADEYGVDRFDGVAGLDVVGRHLADGADELVAVLDARGLGDGRCHVELDDGDGVGRADSRRRLRAVGPGDHLGGPLREVDRRRLFLAAVGTPGVAGVARVTVLADVCLEAHLTGPP